MNWEAIGAVGEIIGAIAVLITLIYLALQVRQNTRQIALSTAAARLSAFEQNITSGNRIREFFLTHPELMTLYGKGCKSYVTLERIEKQKFGLLVRNVFSEVQGGYIRQQSIEHDPKGYDGIAQIVDEIVRAPGVQEYLQNHQPDWHPEFQEFVKQRIKGVRVS